MKKQRKLFLPFLILNLINVGPFNKAVGPGKLINVGPMFIPEFRVVYAASSVHLTRVKNIFQKK